MTRPLTILWSVIVSRALPPVVLGFFLLLYVGIAFISGETLGTLMELTRKSLPLVVLLALIPINSLARLVNEAARFRRRRSMLKRGDFTPGIFHEEVAVRGACSFNGLPGLLLAAGYKGKGSGGRFSAWRGFSAFPSRVFFLLGTFCLFTGILISLTTRNSHRVALIEGEPFPASVGGRGRVERIDLRKDPGLLLERNLSIRVTEGDTNGKTFGLYPPAFHNGSFVYPRYLGIAPQVSFFAPDVPNGFATHFIVMIYPPGREDSADIPGTRYRIVLRLEVPEEGGDPYVTGRMVFKFKLLRGEELLFDGAAPLGGEFRRDGYTLAFPDFRRFVATDFVRDWGVWFIWGAGFLFIAAVSFWLPVRLFLPRRELVFLQMEDGIIACSLTEGRAIQHAGVFHEAIDLLAHPAA